MRGQSFNALSSSPSPPITATASSGGRNSVANSHVGSSSTGGNGGFGKSAEANKLAKVSNGAIAIKGQTSTRKPKCAATTQQLNSAGTPQINSYSPQ
jgi:hypothetical protein